MIIYVRLVTLLTGFFMVGCPVLAQKQRPNILLIMADDLGFSDLGCYGSEIKTPNLDRLAKGGVRLTQFYNTGRCCPSRASLLTGLYPHQAGVGAMNYSAVPSLPAYQGYLSEHSVTIAEVLKTQGYRTYMSGKWHVGDAKAHWPQQRGFDQYFGPTIGGGSYFEPLKPYTNLKVEVSKMVSDNQEWFPTPGKPFYMTTALTDSALTYLDKPHGADSPFFLYLAYTAPHWPLHALPEDIARYRGRYEQGWDKLRQERYQRQQQLGIIDKKWPLSPRYSEQVPAWDSVPAPEKARWTDRMTVYAAMIDRMDREIGRVLDKLKATGADRNTLILFLSDNGGCHEEVYKWGHIINDQSGPTGQTTSFDSYGYPWANVSNTPFRLFKHWTGEGGISSPLIAYFPPGIAAGQLIHQPAHITDLLATCADYAGARYPQTYHGNRIQPTVGVSLRPVLAGLTNKNSNAIDRPIFWEHEGNRAVRVGKWKLMSTYRNGADGPWELYDMAADRTELADVSSRYPAIVNRLKTRYQTWANLVGVRSPTELDALRQAMAKPADEPKK